MRAHVARKGIEQALREVRSAPEQRGARALARQWESRGGLPSEGPKVLFLTPRSWASHVQQEALIGHALALRGAVVEFASCGGGLEICDRSNISESPPMPCRTCTGYTEPSIDAHGFARHSLIQDGTPESSWLELDSIAAQDLLEVEYEGLPLGAIIDIPTQWFLLTTNTEDPLVPLTRRRFLRSARRIAVGLGRVLDQVRPDRIVVLNGGFLFEAVAIALARQRQLPFTSYERGFRNETLFFKTDDAAIDYDMGGAWETHRRVPLTPRMEKEVDELISSRRSGLKSFSPSGRPSIRPHGGGTTFVLFTNLTWDSAVIHREVAFAGVRDWIEASIEGVRRRPDTRLIVRIHPAEVKLPGMATREPFRGLIDSMFPELPANVTLIDADDATSSYHLMDLADVGLVYTSTTGLEMVLGGKPVIVAAKTHYRGRGFTLDAVDPKSFEDLLDRATADHSSLAPNVDLARRYFHALMFRRHLSSWFVSEPVPGLARLNVTDLRQLEPGEDRSIDAICDGILRSGQFELPTN